MDSTSLNEVAYFCADSLAACLGLSKSTEKHRELGSGSFLGRDFPSGPRPWSKSECTSEVVDMVKYEGAPRALEIKLGSLQLDVHDNSAGWRSQKLSQGGRVFSLFSHR